MQPIPHAAGWKYLRDVLTKLPTLTNQQIKHWTPHAYARRLRSEQQLQAAS
ncbi:MAG: hypothetical protein ACFUZC_10875 [Chthoniobacteraceae bacterium]